MKIKYFKLVFGLCFFASLSMFSQTNRGLWTQKNTTQELQKTTTSPNSYKAFTLDFEKLKNNLSTTPKRGEASGNSNLIIQFPNAEGKLESFRITEASTMTPELQAKFPEVRSFVGQGIDDPTAIIRFSISPERGLSSTVLSDKKSVYIEKSLNTASDYFVYKRTALDTKSEEFICETEYMKQNSDFDLAAARNANDGKLRTFRLALACTGEYAAFHGGTEAGVISAMNATMTRVNGVFERDLSLTNIDSMPLNGFLMSLAPSLSVFSVLKTAHRIFACHPIDQSPVRISLHVLLAILHRRCRYRREVDLRDCK